MSSDLVEWDPAACPAKSDEAGSTAYGLWLPTRAIAGTSPLGRERPFGISTKGGDRDAAVSLIQVWSSEYRTPSGLHVGSTDAEVATALPRASVLETPQSREYSVESSGWILTLTVGVFEGSVTRDSVVQLITVSDESTRGLTWWATDVGAFCGV